MKVELTSEAVDGLMQSILLQDYRGLCEDINRLEGSDSLKEHQQQDLDHNHRYREAMEVLMEYYIGFQWRDEL